MLSNSSLLRSGVRLLPTAFLLTACLSNKSLPSIWPPDDFYLDVSGVETNETGTHRRQRFQVWADGLAVYREAKSELPNCPIPIPLYSRVCAYRLDPASIRSLAQKLQRRRLYERDDIRADNPRFSGRHVIVSWRAQEQEGQTSSLIPTSNLDPVVNLINAFLPEGRRFDYPDLGGSEEEPELLRVPQPHESLQGALDYHLQLLAAHPEIEDLELHTFALAIAAGDYDEARRRLAVIETYSPSEVIGEVWPEAGWEPDFLELLRGMLR